jgi:hypothetical protein
LRRLRLPEIGKRAYQQLHEELAAALAAERAKAHPAPTTRLEYREQLLEQRRAQEAERAQGPKRAGRPRLDLDQLKEVAAIHAAAYAARRPPRQAVAEALKISPTAAASRIARCRAVGLLCPSQRGKPAVGPLLHGSDADVLESLVRIEKFMAQRNAQEGRGEEERS